MKGEERFLNNRRFIYVESCYEHDALKTKSNPHDHFKRITFSVIAV